MKNKPDDICFQISEKIDAFLDGEVSISEQQEIEAHLKSCDACREVYRHARQVQDALTSLPEKECPDSVIDAILLQLSEDTDRAHAEKPPVSKRSGILYYWRFAAAAIVLIGIIGILIMNRPREITERYSYNDVALAEEQVKATFGFIHQVSIQSADTVRNDIIKEKALSPIINKISDFIIRDTIQEQNEGLKEG